MKTKTRIVWFTGGLLALTALTACEPSEKRTENPGALPKNHGASAPKLNASTYAAHGELLERRGEFERAAEQYRKALELTPDLSSARNRLGVTLNKLGKHAEASAEFRRAIAQKPSEPYLYNNLGFSLYLEEKYADAEPVIAKALELQPEFQRARMNHGLVLARLARYDEAYAEFAKAGSAADAHFNVAVIQAEQGAYVDAARSLDEALRSNPNFDAAREQLREISKLAAAQEAETNRLAAEKAEAERVAAAQAQAERLAAEQTAQPQPALQPEPTAVLAADAIPVTDATKSATENPAKTTPPPSGNVVAAKNALPRIANFAVARPATSNRKLYTAAAAPKAEQFGTLGLNLRYFRIAQAAKPFLSAAIKNETPQNTAPLQGRDLVAFRREFDELTRIVSDNSPDAQDLLNQWEQRLGIQ